MIAFTFRICKVVCVSGYMCVLQVFPENALPMYGRVGSYWHSLETVFAQWKYEGRVLSAPGIKRKS